MSALVFVGDVNDEEMAWYRALDEKYVAYMALPKCARCRRPTPDESVDPYWWEAGETMCDDCGQPERPGRRPGQKRRPHRPVNREPGAPARRAVRGPGGRFVAAP